MHSFFDYLNDFNETILWGYLGLFMIIAFGLYLSFKARWIQVFQFKKAFKHFISCTKKASFEEDEDHGASPIKLFFATIGGAIGIGNIAGVALAVQIGGPGALVWVLLVALLGMIIKYSEVYLGIKYRKHVPSKKGYEGGPMYFLQKAFPKCTWIAYAMAFFLCIYGVEIYMFNVVKYSFQTNFHLDPNLVMIGFLALIFLGVFGGTERVGSINSVLIPTFVLLYMLMTLWVIVQEIHLLPSILKTILTSAFTGHAAAGGFAGSTFLLALSKGLSAGAYSGDIGIGYASIIHSQTRFKDPSKQASLTILGIFLDTFIVCTCTILLVVVTGVWQSNIDSSLLVQEALSHYFPFMEYFMPACLFILGYSTITSYFIAGVKCAEFILPKYGKRLYMIYGFTAFITFSFVETRYAFAVMSTAGGLLMVINLMGIMKLRKDIVYKV
jgi:AGCS family alanine or glycine:cation symporter